VSSPKGASQTLGRFIQAHNGVADERQGATLRVASSLEEGKKLCLFVSYPTLARESARTRNSYSCNYRTMPSRQIQQAKSCVCQIQNDPPESIGLSAVSS
jgi:hypothetical protein